jgi:DNA-binding response OmpR family regulator
VTLPGSEGADATSQAAGVHPTILLVDDDPTLVDALGVGLEFQWPGCHLVVAGNGDAALDAFQSHRPDLVLLDITMPSRNGWEVLQWIRRMSDVPIIILSAHAEESAQVQARALGADAYVVKPFAYLALVERMKRCLRRSPRRCSVGSGAVSCQPDGEV